MVDVFIFWGCNWIFRSSHLLVVKVKVFDWINCKLIKEKGNKTHNLAVYLLPVKEFMRGIY